jgi:hypothetical protein
LTHGQGIQTNTKKENNMKKIFWELVLMIAVLSAIACSDDKKNTDECNLDDPDCPAGEFCQAIQDAGPQCLEPIMIKGMVIDAVDESPVAGALVQALDPNKSSIGTSDETDVSGTYSLMVPAAWDVEGNPMEGSYTLSVQAAEYQPFPSAIRPALPLDAASAINDGNGWVLENPITTVSLLPLPGDTSNLGAISGIITADNCAGVLVVAEASADSGFIGYSNSNCAYTIFNVAAGSYTVTGYAKGLQLQSVETTVEENETKIGVDIGVSDNPLSTVSGTVQIVNAPGDSVTSVVLAIESTFVESFAIGQVPPGLRVGEVIGAFTFEDVPDGHYVVLAAFENDNLVRDPDESIGGTQIVHIEVPDPDMGNTITISEGFKVTEALAVVSPGKDAPEQVTSPTPTFIWADDSSEKAYEIIVRDAFGEEIWRVEIDGVSGSDVVEHTYAGPDLETGMYYQFKATSKNGDGDSLSTTEDLRGVFYL